MKTACNISRRHFIVKITGAVALAVVSLHAAQAGTDTAVPDLIQRILPRQTQAFVVETKPAENDRDAFEIENRAGKIVLRGNNGIAQAAAFNWYLKHVAGGGISLSGDQLTLPDPLPLPAQKIHQVTPYARIDWQTGANAIIIHGASLDQTVAMAVDSKRVAADDHAGRSGMVTKDNDYVLKVDNVVPGAKYLLRVIAEGDNGNNSQGRIQFNK